MGIISRGFSGRRSAADVKLPPGQYLTTDFREIRADRFYLTILGSLTRQCVMNWKHLDTYLSHQRHQSATTGDLQLGEDGMKMFFHRFETQAAFVGNLLIAAPIAH